MSESGTERELPRHHDKTIRLSTLDPRKLTEQDIHDISGVGRCNCYFPPTLGPRPRANIAYLAGPFPPETRGVFYFDNRSSVHAVAGGIRFRILPTGPSQEERPLSVEKIFRRGHDLLDDSGRPWDMSLYSIIAMRRAGIYDFLKLHGYITDVVEAPVHRLACRLAKAKYSVRPQVIEKIGDAFILDLSKTREPFVFLQEEGAFAHVIYTRQAVTVRSRKGDSLTESPYSGTLLVWYEMIQHQKRNRIVIRVLKLLTPPNPGDAVMQEEGELFKKYHPVQKVESVWMTRSDGVKFMTPSSIRLLEQKYL